MEQARGGAAVDAAGDYSVHGLVTIRLENAPASAREALVHELGAAAGAGSGPPDITVTFTPRLRPAGELRFLDVGQAAFDDQSFYLLDDAGRRTQIDFTALGTPCRLLCEMGVRRIPLLVPLVSLALLGKGYALLHASSFVYQGRGALVTGWKKGGKTEMLLAFMAAGAHYLADEWTIVGGETARLYGLAALVPTRDWHLRQQPRLWRRITSRDRLRLRLFRLYRGFYDATPALRALPSIPGQALRELRREDGAARLGLAVNPPDDLFPGRVWRGPAPLDRVFLGVAAAGPISVAPAPPEVIAQRMVHSLAYERADLLRAYQQFRFAFPDRESPAIEGAQARELGALTQALAGAPAFEIRHPYPVPLAALYHAAKPYC
jgi:hypothetical protein